MVRFPEHRLSRDFSMPSDYSLEGKRWKRLKIRESNPNRSALFPIVNKKSSEAFFLYTDGKGRPFRIGVHLFSL